MDMVNITILYPAALVSAGTRIEIRATFQRMTNVTVIEIFHVVRLFLPN